MLKRNHHWAAHLGFLNLSDVPVSDSIGVAAITSNNPEVLRLEELRYSDMGDSYEESKQRARETGFDSWKRTGLRQ